MQMRFWAGTGSKNELLTVKIFARILPVDLPSAVEPFHYYWYGERIVHLNGCVEAEAAYYGTRFRSGP